MGWQDAGLGRLQGPHAALPRHSNGQCFDVQEMLADNNAVAVSWLWHGTHLGEIAGFPPTGKPIRMSGITIYYFDEHDRPTGHWQIVDRLGVFQQLAAANGLPEQ